MSVARRPRAAILAFVAQPNLGSEYEVGWRWPFLAKGVVRPYVLSRLECWRALPGRARQIGELQVKTIDGVHFIAIDVSFGPRFFQGRRLTRTHYLIWQIMVLFWLRANRSKFDLVHHVNFVAAWFPPLAPLSGIPFVWGPIGTNPPMPRFYRDRLPFVAKVRAAVRTFVTQSMVRWNPLYLIVAPRCRAAFAISAHVRGLLPKTLRERTQVHPGIAIDPSWFGAAPDTGPTGETLLYVGRAMDIKLPRLAYRVAADVIRERPGTNAVFVGEGLPALLEGEVGNLCIEVREHMAQDTVRALYRSAAVFLFPSVEASGFVTLEALANGLPVACLDGTGAAYFAGPDNPMTVSSKGDWGDVQSRLSASIVAYLSDAARGEMSETCRARARLFMWESYRSFLEKFYADAQSPRWRERTKSINAK